MEFTKEQNDIFLSIGVEIQFVPIEFRIKESKRNLKPIKFASVQEYERFLRQELTFWKDNSDDNFINKYISNFTNSINYLKNAANSGSGQDFKTYLGYSVNAIKSVPNSKSVLSKEILKHKGESTNFYEGFFDAIKSEDVSLTSGYDRQKKNYVKGLYRGFQYLEIIKKIEDLLPEQIEIFQNAQIDFVNTAEEYIKKYDELYQQKDLEFTEMDKKIDSELEKQRQEAESFFLEKEERMKSLELLYKDNLKLKEPANYWDETRIKYTKNAEVWISVAAIIGLLTIGLLTYIIINLSKTNNQNWYFLLKSTAIITVITSLLIYAIRVCVKLAMSSFHLARDAAERHQLTYFYLSLINENAINDTERELVITSLFSRSDTGLLKGDASPEMPNVSLNDFLNKK